MDRPFRPVNATPPRRPSLRLSALALPLLLLASACSIFEAPTIQRGNRVTEDQLREITPGVQTKADVQALLGSPTQTSTFGDNVWYYLSSSTRQRPGRQLLLSDQQSVVVEFDTRGVVREVRRVTEGQPVEMVSRETPVPGNDRSLLQALFGNIGRFGPGATTGAGQGQTAPGPGAPSGR
jgi:outer membrane protein assembly factor BamE (lipoprotein component of BamABCDE complex)